MRISCRSNAWARFCVTPPTRTPCAKLCNFFMPSAAPVIRRSSRKTWFNSANRTIMPDANIREIVKEKYGQAALRVTHKTGGSSCCGAAAAIGLSCDPITLNLYDEAQARQIPEEAMLASLGCGNPTPLAQLSARGAALHLRSVRVI